MTKRFASLTSTLLLALGIAAFTGSALAGNGNGNGAGNAATPSASAQAQASGGPGNSENAPGQLKKDSASAQGNGGTGSAGQNTATSTGLKPTNATFKDTRAPASSNRTKRYGNGQTAGQIAMQNGAPPSTMLHGPGNSQPHKAVLCPGSKHEVDVHALKAKGQQKKCATTSSAQASKPTASSAVVTHSPSVSSSAGTRHASAVAGAQSQGGVLGVTTSAGKSGPVGGVLGAIASVGQGVLPFTGFPLWLAMLAALTMILLGLALRRRARATV